MFKKNLLCLILFVLGGLPVAFAADPSPGAIGIGDPIDPLLGNGGYDVQHYTLTLDVDVEANFVEGSAEIDMIAMQDLNVFNLDLFGLEVLAVEVNDQPAEFIRIERELTIMPADPILNGEAYTTRVVYRGTPEPVSLSLSGIGWVQFDGGIYVASQPIGAATWFPNNDHPLDKATYTFDITVPKPYVVAANGLLQNETDNGQTVTYLWEASDLMASYLATVTIAEFEVQESVTADGLPIRNYLQNSLAPVAATHIERTPQMIEFYTDLFGEYPFEAYGAIYVDVNPGFLALETQTISLFGNLMFGDVRGGPELVVAHELVHQWFGNSVSLSNWQDIWLNEGFATYGSFLWIEEQFGRTQLDALMENQYAALATEQFMPGAPAANNLFNTGVYIQGAWTLHALRLEVGDDAFFEILKAYYAAFRDGNATTADFIAIVEDISGQDLADFFEAWLFDGGVPPMPTG